MIHLHTRQASIHHQTQVLQAQRRSTHRTHRMGNHRHTPSLTHQTHRLQRVQRILRHIVGAARVQQLRKSLRTISNHTGSNQRISDMGAAHRRVPLPHLRQHVIPGQRVVSGKTAHNSLRTALTAGTNRLHTARQLRTHRVKTISEQMNSLRACAALTVGVPVTARELGTRQKIQTVLTRQLSRLRPTSRRIVISQRKPSQPGASNQRHQLGQALRAVRNSGVNMQIVTPGTVQVFRRTRFSGLRCLLRIRCTISVFCLRHILSFPAPASSSPPQRGFKACHLLF